jgi:dTDP-4-amino-4,6-dideoxygalactose transaminase
MPAGPDNPVTIPFNRPFLSGLELTYIEEAVARGQLSGDGWFTDQCHSWLEATLGTGCALLTHSGTAALEMAALLLDIGPGDEVIMPSYTFVSTANAVVLRGGVPVFVDIRADTLNIDETLIEQAITKRTRAILVVHYGGIACEMDAIMEIAQRHKLHVIEDAAHAILAAYKGRMLGTIGDLGCLSFHETKNITSGEGGALLVNRPGLVKRAEILRQKGTDRSAFQRGQVNKYTWVDLGSSFLPGEKTAAFLLAQLQQASSITARRRALWAHYHAAFQAAWQAGLVTLPVVPEGCTQNGHLYHLLLSSAGQRTDFIEHMSGLGIITPFHYVPLHNSPGGLKYGRPGGSLDITTDVAERLVRLPMWLGLEGRLQQAVIAAAQSILAAGSEPSVAGRVGA